MAKILTSRRFGLWWQLARRWFKKENTALLNAIQNITQNISINIEDIDTTVVALESTTAKEATLTAGVADIKGDVAVVKDKVENIDFSTLAKQGDNPAATNSSILEAMSHISPTDPNSLALAQFFGVTLLEGYEFMQDTEVCDELEDIMQVIDPNLTAERAAAITAQAMNIINDDEEQS